MSEGRRIGDVVALRPQNMVDVVFADLDYPIRRPAGALTVMKTNPKPKTPVFVAAVLTPEAKRELYRYWVTQPLAPEPLPIMKSSHMTIMFRPSLADIASMPIGQEVQLRVIGWASDNKIQAVAVDPVGVGSANVSPHVTFALADVSVPPKLSNDLFAGAATRHKIAAGPTITARVGWSDGANYHFEMPEGVQSNPGPRGGLVGDERSALPDSAFALPGRRWPINDRRHAVIAMQYMLRGFGNASTYPTILKAIEKRYPRSDRRNAEIWDFHAKHFGAPARPNPAGEAYDPAKEQFRAQTQGIYESLIRKKFGLHYKTPFVDASGRRLDAPLSPEEKRKLFSSAFAIATRQGQKHGYLEPGTQTPTEKGRARAYERLSETQAEHAAANRQDWERTLGAVRKSAYYRVVPTETVDRRGRKVMQYQVQPTPPADAGIPAYRLSQRAAELDAVKAERFRAQAPSAARLRMNPRVIRDRVPDVVQGELQYIRLMNEFSEMPPQQAREVLRKNVIDVAEFIRGAQALLASQGLDWTEDSDNEKVAATRGVWERNKRFIIEKYESRPDDFVNMYPSVEALSEQLNKLSTMPPPQAVAQGRALYRQLERSKGEGFFKALAKWKAYRDMRDTETVRAMTEGAKVGGIAGSGKNRAESEPLRLEFLKLMEEVNKHVRDEAPAGAAVPQLTQEVFEVEHPYVAVRNFILDATPFLEREGKIAYSNVPHELRLDITTPSKPTEPPMLNLHYMGTSLEVIPESAEVQKSENQENALDRQQEGRLHKKYLQTAQRGFDTSQAFWDVERVLLYYTKKVDKDGKVIIGASGHPFKQYHTYTLRPDQTLESALKETGFVPFAVPVGKDGDLQVEKPSLQTRYVIYIPRARRTIMKKLRTGRALTPSMADLEGLKGVKSPGGFGLRPDQQPLDAGRPKRKFALWQDRGIVDPEGIISVYPSMKLAKYFYVKGQDGIGGAANIESAEKSLASIQAQQSGQEEIANAIGTVSEAMIEGVPMSQFFLQTALSRAKAARAEQQKTQKVFLSPEDNWVKYHKLTNVFRRLKQGSWDPEANEGAGGYSGGVDIPQYDVFYTLSAPLAYLTIMYFNSPDALPHVRAKMEDVANVLKELAPTQTASGDTYENLEPVRVGSIAVLDIDPETRKVLQRPDVRPLPSKAETMGDLSVSRAQFLATPLNVFMTQEAQTAQEAAREHDRLRRLGIEDRLMATLKVQEQALRSGTLVGEYGGKAVYSLAKPEAAPAAPEVVGAVDFDIEDLLGNPRPRPSRTSRLRNRKY